MQYKVREAPKNANSQRQSLADIKKIEAEEPWHVLKFFDSEVGIFKK